MAEEKARVETAPGNALVSALTTEHFVMQGALTAAVTEQGARSSTFLMTLSSALVAFGFLSDRPQALWPFVAVVLPALFVMGVLTVMRLVDIAGENMQAQIALARIRREYRRLGLASPVFSAANGRWPEGEPATPSLWAGPVIGFMTSAASMLAAVTAVIAGVGAGLAAARFDGVTTSAAIAAGAVTSAALFAGFYVYQARRVDELYLQGRAIVDGPSDTA